MSAQKLLRLQQFLEADPANLNLLSDIANCAYELKQFDDVLKYVSKGLQLDPENRGLRALGATASLALGNIPSATIGFQGLVTEGEDDASIRYNLAYCYALEARYEQALPLLADAIDRYSDFPQMLHLEVRMHYFMGHLEAAIELGKQAIQLNPTDAIVHELLASLYVDESNFLAAQHHSDLALELNPNRALAHTSSGTVALSVQDDGKAQSHFDRALAINPKDGRAWLGKAMAEMLQNNLESAENSFKTALQHMPNHLGTWQAMAWCQLAKHDLDAAEATARKALEMDDTFSENHGTLAVIAVLRGDMERAQLSIRRALGLDRESFSGLYAQALLLKQQGCVEASQKLIDDMLDQPMMPDQRSLRDVLIKQMGKQKI